jgi:hypothetical protein
MLKLANVIQRRIYDLGSGRWPHVITAAQKFGGGGGGIELDRQLVMRRTKAQTGVRQDIPPDRSVKTDISEGRSSRCILLHRST